VQKTRIGCSISIIYKSLLTAIEGHFHREKKKAKRLGNSPAEELSKRPSAQVVGGLNLNPKGERGPYPNISEDASM